MRCIVVAIAYSLFVPILNAQDYTKDCPDTYAFNFAGLEWYDTIHLEWGSNGGEPDHCMESDPGYYFGYNPATNPATGAQDGSTQSGCVCAYQTSPVSVMFVPQPRVVPVSVIDKGVVLKDGTTTPPDLDILFDKVVVAAKDPNGTMRYFLCLAAFRKLDPTQASPVTGDQIRLATEIAKPKYAIVNGTLRKTTGPLILEVRLKMTIGNSPTTDVVRQMNFIVR